MRVKAINHIRQKGYTSVLDLGCGLCIDYMGYVKNGVAIKYQGLEVSQLLVDRAQGMGFPVKQGSIENIPFADSTFDVCYARHILEHLEHYKLAISEMVRVARREVLIVFFIRPWVEPDCIHFEEDRAR